MDFSDIFRIVNLGIGALMVLGAVEAFFDSFSIHNIVTGIYLVVFGLSTAGLEFQIPPQVSRYASFMFSFLGRGLFYLFVGSIMLGDYWYRYVPGGIVALVGIAYGALEFIPSIEPPANMREAADAGWGAEQV